MKRRILAGLSSLVFLLLFSAVATAQSKPDKVRIGYAARAVAHSVPFVAKEAGFFAEEGIDAEIIRTAGSIAPMALVANEVDLAIMSAYLMLPVAAQNKDVVMLGGFSRYASMVFVARPDVKGAQDLKGKIIGIQRPGLLQCLAVLGAEKLRQDAHGFFLARLEQMNSTDNRSQRAGRELRVLLHEGAPGRNRRTLILELEIRQVDHEIHARFARE